jgi:hypothetical protein
LQALFDVLLQDRFTIIGPTIDQEAIVYAEIESVTSLPQGWTDEQNAATYRLQRRDDDALFGYNVGPQSWKQYLFPPLSTLTVATKDGSGWVMKTAEDSVPKYAFVGVRSCELAAIGVQDRVFMGGPVDPIYASRRNQAFVIAVNCTERHRLASTSMQTGLLHFRLRSRPDRSARGFTVDIGSPKAKFSLASSPRQRLHTARIREQARRQALIRSPAAWTQRIFGIDCSQISSIRIGKRWQHAAFRARIVRWSVRPASAVP